MDKVGKEGVTVEDGKSSSPSSTWLKACSLTAATCPYFINNPEEAVRDSGQPICPALRQENQQHP
jgi:hypothetical protein